MSIWLWVGFLAFMFAMLALDLGVFHRESRSIGAREAFIWTAVWFSLALIFNVLVYVLYDRHLFGAGMREGGPRSGSEAAQMFFTGYLVELSLSMDNVFVIALIFKYFRIPNQYQHRVLFWGIVGAQVLRGVLIVGGAVLIARFHWIIYVFGVFLIVTAVRMLLAGDHDPDPERNILVRLARRVFPVSMHLEGERFFTRVNGQRAMTPLFLVLLVVESTDVVFAVDSIPAIFAITQDPFIVFTSNMFAILGLRSLYFALAAMIEKFRYLKASLVFLLAFIGIKMLLSGRVEIPINASMAIILGILAVGIVASVLANIRESAPTISAHEDDGVP